MDNLRSSGRCRPMRSKLYILLDDSVSASNILKNPDRNRHCVTVAFMGKNKEGKKVRWVEKRTDNSAQPWFVQSTRRFVQDCMAVWMREREELIGCGWGQEGERDRGKVKEYHQRRCQTPGQAYLKCRVPGSTSLRFNSRTPRRENAHHNVHEGASDRPDTSYTSRKYSLPGSADYVDWLLPSSPSSLCRVLRGGGGQAATARLYRS